MDGARGLVKDSNTKLTYLTVTTKKTQNVVFPKLYQHISYMDGLCVYEHTTTNLISLQLAQCL